MGHRIVPGELSDGRTSPATQSRVSSLGKRNSGGMTPMTSRISPETKYVFPTTDGVAAEPGAPEPIADEHDPIAVVRDRQPPDLRPYAERRVDVVRRERHRHPLDAILRTQRRGPCTERENAVEELRALLVVQVELLAEPETLREVRPRRSAGHDDEAVCIREWERPEQNSIDDAEHPDHGADGKGEGHDAR